MVDSLPTAHVLRGVAGGVGRVGRGGVVLHRVAARAGGLAEGKM